MEMMSNKFDQQNTNLNEFKTEIKSEINANSVEMNNKFDQQNTSLNEFKIEIKSEINASNIELKTEINKQDEKLREINNEFVNIRSEIEMSKLSMNNQFKSNL